MFTPCSARRLPHGCWWCLLLMLSLSSCDATTLVTLGNISIWPLERTTGIVQRNDEPWDVVPVTVGETCVVDSRVARVIRLDVDSSAFCDQLQPSDACYSYSSTGADDGGWYVRWVTVNISIAATANSTLTSAWLVGDSDDINMDSWFATLRFSRLNGSSHCACIERVFVIDSDTGSIVAVNQTGAQLAVAAYNLGSGAQLFLSCVFGVGTGEAPDFGVSAGHNDGLIYDPDRSAITRFRSVADLTTRLKSVLSTMLTSDSSSTSQPSSSTAVNQFSLLGAFPSLLTSNAAAAAWASTASSSMMHLWLGNLVFCNQLVTNVRSISGGELRTTGVMVKMDWSLQDVYAIIPLEVAKSIAIRSILLDTTSCASECSNEPLSRSQRLKSAFAPCSYVCVLHDAYQWNASSAPESDLYDLSELGYLLPPLFVDVAPQGGSDSPAILDKALQLNLSVFLNVRGTQRVLTIPTWPAASADTSTPIVALGGKFSAISAQGDVMKFAYIDRSTATIGIAPSVTSSTLTGATKPVYAAVCDPSPICDASKGEVLITELNRCVDTACSDFFIMHVDAVTGSCTLKMQLVVSAAVLLVIAAAGEILLTYVNHQTHALVLQLVSPQSNKEQ